MVLLRSRGWRWGLNRGDRSMSTPEDIQRLVAGIFPAGSAGAVGGEDPLSSFGLTPEDDLRLSGEPLSETQLLVIALHIKGIGSLKIAQFVGKTLPWVTNTLSLSSVARVLNLTDLALEQEIKGMKGLAVDAMRDVLERGNHRDKSGMVEKYFKITGRYEEKNATRETAEDIIAKMLCVLQTQAETNQSMGRDFRSVIDGHCRLVESVDIIEEN